MLGQSDVNTACPAPRNHLWAQDISLLPTGVLLHRGASADHYAAPSTLHGDAHNFNKRTADPNEGLESASVETCATPNWRDTLNLAHSFSSFFALMRRY